MKRLVDLFSEKYGTLTTGVPSLSVGMYEVKKYFILDNENYIKHLYLDTDKGLYKSSSKFLINSMIAGLGDIMQEQFDNNETVLIEVVNQRSKNGKFGLAIRTG